MNASQQNLVVKAVRRFCLECQGGTTVFVRACSDTVCPLYAFRLRPEEMDSQTRPLRAIRQYCLTCAETRQDIRKCDAKTDCPLWSYRFGVLPSTFRRVVARCHAPKMQQLPTNTALPLLSEAP